MVSKKYSRPSDEWDSEEESEGFNQENQIGNILAERRIFPDFSRLDLSGLKLSDIPFKFFTNTNSGTSLNDFPQELLALFQEENIKIKKSIQYQKRQLEKYENNWDDNGAEHFSERTLENTSSIINSLYDLILSSSPLLLDFLPNPHLLPNPDGSIDIVWRNNELYLLLNVSKDNKYSIAGKSITGDNWTLKSTKNFERNLLEWFNLVFNLG
jgi:hypothetical protein